MDIAHILSVALDVGTALLALLGALKVLARYTSTEADDKVLAAIEKPIAALVSLVKK